MANTIQIKRTVTSTAPNSNTGGGGNVITVGELAYSYSSADGSGNESGTGKLYIGHADGAAGTNSAAIIGGSYFTTLLDHTAGTLTASSAIITNAQNHVDAVKTTGLYLGASGSAVLVSSTSAELNILDGVTSSTAELNILDGVTATATKLNYVNVTPGTATASKAVVLDSNLHMNAVKTTGLYLGASGSAVLVSSTSAELNILDGATLAVAELNILDGATVSTAELNKLDGVTATTAKLNYVDVTAGTATASKAVVLDSNSHINTVKTAALHIGSSGSETQVTASAAELNLLNNITAIDTDLSSVAGTHTTLASALATKTYVDNTRSGLEVKDSAVVATTANLAATYANGSSGVGATLTNSGSQAAIAIDGITLTSGQRVLVKDQSTASQNGLYKVSTVGDGSTNWMLIRTTDADTASELSSGVFFFVEKGTANFDNGYVMTQDTAISFGSTSITFSQFSGAGQITAGNGLAKSSNTLSVNTGTGITITSDNVVIDTSWAGQTAITTLGTIGTGTWNATAISATKGGTGLNTSGATGVGIVTSGTWSTPTSLTVPFGGTGVATFTSNGILYGNGAGVLQVTAAGADGAFLYSNSGTPEWITTIDGGSW